MSQSLISLLFEWSRGDSKWNSILLFLVLCWSHYAVHGYNADIRQSIHGQGRGGSFRDVCSRDPQDINAPRSPGDGGFRIQIVGNAERYSPEQVYTVKLSGSYRDQTLAGFLLVAVPQYARDESTTMGTFQHLDSYTTRFAPQCPHIVTHVDLRLRHEIDVLWTAPAAGVGCVEFRAVVIQKFDTWFKDEGALKKTFCEETGTTENHHSPDMLPDCCACGSAKYEITFEGHWSQHSHPKDYPTQKRLLHWSNIVGASHSKNYMVWQYGAYASKGVKEVCEFGYPRTVEEEIKQNSKEVRSIIKTTGIWWKEPQGLDQTRQARFSADRRRHLVSMLTMLGPSPDWCVGISAVDLCLPNCTWSRDLQIDLYPWDSGTDDGITYMAPNAKSEPQQKIHKITNSFPNDPGSPFYGSQPIRRLASVRLQRLSPTDGSDPAQCAESDTVDSEVDFIGSSSAGVSDMEKEKQMMMAEGGKCAMSPWQDWSSCSVTCGVGQRFHKRMYLNPMVDESMCGLPTMESENCIGVENECETVDEDCAVTQWSNWSPCSATCGKGMRERRRYYLNKEDMARCDRTTEEVEICMDRVDCTDINNSLNYTVICSLPSLPGPCRGSFERWYFDIYMQKCLPFSYGGCRGNLNRFLTMDECTEACQLHAPTERPFDLRPPSNQAPPRTDRCSLSSDRGPCNRLEQLWFYDQVMQKCLPFYYGGCYGNQNRFQTEEECSQACSQLDDHFQSQVNARRQGTSNQRTESIVSTAAPSISSATKSTPRSVLRNSNGFKGINGSPNNVSNKPISGLHSSKLKSIKPAQNCVVSRWSDWSSCSTTCGEGYHFKRREVKQPEANGGKACPRNLEQKKKCVLPSCEDGCVLSDWGPWSPCSRTCGYEGIQERSRHVMRENGDVTGEQSTCRPRLQRRFCSGLPSC